LQVTWALFKKSKPKHKEHAPPRTTKIS